MQLKSARMAANRCTASAVVLIVCPQLLKNAMLEDCMPRCKMESTLPEANSAKKRQKNRVEENSMAQICKLAPSEHTLPSATQIKKNQHNARGQSPYVLLRFCRY